MSTSELDRLRDDLSTIRAVTGGDLPFDRSDVRGVLVIACCALLPAVAGLSGTQSRWLLLASAVPFSVAVLSQIWRNYRACHPSKACPYEKRKEYRLGIPILLACLPLVPGFHFWATRSGAPAAVANGCVFLFLGLLLLLDGIYNSGRRAAVFPAIAAIIGGLMWPYCEYFQFWTLLWSCFGVALICASVVMHRQLITRDQHDARSH
jgi:hypothetical protein